MKVVLYHGSEKKTVKPVFGQDNPANDYGLGFYCTRDRTRYRQMRQSFDPQELTMLDILRKGLHHGDSELS